MDALLNWQPVEHVPFVVGDLTKPRYTTTDGDRTKWQRTKWYGQNGMDKMVYGQNGIGQNGMDKMERTKWQG